VLAVTQPEIPPLARLLGRLFGAEPETALSRLIERIGRVLRLDGDVYTEIEADPAGIPQAFAVVLVSAFVAGVGQWSPVLVFLGVAWALFAWLLSALLVWGAASLVLARDVEYPRLLVGLGHAYAWIALLVLARLPGLLGALVGVVALGLCFIAFVQAAERALRIATDQALAICAVALILPFILLLIALL
jgi:hypothetical protein